VSDEEASHIMLTNTYMQWQNLVESNSFNRLIQTLANRGDAHWMGLALKRDEIERNMQTLRALLANLVRKERDAREGLVLLACRANARESSP
jgi:hypothetical protein